MVKQLHVEEYVAHRQEDGAAPGTINKEVSRLHHLFNKAIAWGEIPRNLSAGIRHLKEPPPRVAYLEPHERALLLTECAAFDPVLLAIVSVAMLTGARLSEILALTWSNVDLGRRILTFRKTKSGKVRHVPMNPDLYGILSRLAEERTGADPAAPLFPPPSGAGPGSRQPSAGSRTGRTARAGSPSSRASASTTSATTSRPG